MNFSYSYNHNKKIAESDLDYNLLCIQQLNQTLKVLKCLDCKQNVIDSVKQTISKELKLLQDNRVNLLEKRANYRREQNKLKLAKAQENTKYREAEFDDLTSNMSLADLEILKEFIYKV
jgi:hypothetical protein